MIRKLLLLLFIPISGIGQTQIGADLNGDSADDKSGNGVSFSANGSFVAVGSPQMGIVGTGQGYVRIYEDISGTWTQVGQDIPGTTAGDYSGYKVALSANGNIVAIGSPYSSINGSYSGLVRIFENISGVWTQIGQSIQGEAANDRTGISVSLSANGNVVAIGATGNTANGKDTGRVRVFENVSGTWVQVGQNLDGEAKEDRSGLSTSLSSDGSIVAIGATGNDGNGAYSGHVRVYKNISGTWTQLGADIDGENAGDYSGVSVSLSSDGSILAIGALQNATNGAKSGHVRVFKNSTGTWMQLGQNINGMAEKDFFGESVSLSADGTVLAVGATGGKLNGVTSGSLSIYQYAAGTWAQKGADVYGTASSYTGTSVSLSGDGTKVVVGAPFTSVTATYSGQARVFDLSGVLSTGSVSIGNFNVYPNPVADFVNIEMERGQVLKKVVFYNMFGQIMKVSDQQSINISHFPKGTYMAQIISENGTSNVKVIKN